MSLVYLEHSEKCASRAGERKRTGDKIIRNEAVACYAADGSIHKFTRHCETEKGSGMNDDAIVTGPFEESLLITLENAWGRIDKAKIRSQLEKLKPEEAENVQKAEARLYPALPSPSWKKIEAQQNNI